MDSVLPIILGLDGLVLTDADRERIARHQPYGFILFSRNIAEASQVRALTDEVKSLCEHRPLIGIDNEGGRVWRTASLGPTPPNAAYFGAKGTYQQSAQFGALAGRQLEMLGVNLDFAPVLDIDHQPEDSNALRGRCWGSNSQHIIDHAGNFNRWLRKNGVYSCGKHFPAGGRARVDPHHDLPVVDASLEEMLATDLLPYTALAPELDAIMIAHIRYPQLDSEHPSSLSRRIITDLLRNQLGYDGLVLTDDLDMGAITEHYGRGPDFEQAWLAGNDLPLLCHALDTIDVVAEAYQRLPSDCKFDLERRLSKRLRRLPTVPAFNPDLLEKGHRDLSQLTQDLTGKESFTEESATQSPVEDY